MVFRSLVVGAALTGALVAWDSAHAAGIGAISAPGGWTISLPDKLKADVIADLQNASADAKGQIPPDLRHGPCYDALIGFIQNGFANPLPTAPPNGKNSWCWRCIAWAAPHVFRKMPPRSIRIGKNCTAPSIGC